MCDFNDGIKLERQEYSGTINQRSCISHEEPSSGGLDYTRANALEIMLQKINMEETLTEITVYPDTIWWEREWDGEIKKGEKERENSTKEENIKHPSKYILQTFQCFSEPTIRGQTWESKLPLSPCSGLSGDLSMCLGLLGAQQPRSKLGSPRDSLIIGVVTAEPVIFPALLGSEVR